MKKMIVALVMMSLMLSACKNSANQSKWPFGLHIAGPAHLIQNGKYISPMITDVSSKLSSIATMNAMNSVAPMKSAEDESAVCPDCYYVGADQTSIQGSYVVSALTSETQGSPQTEKTLVRYDYSYQGAGTESAPDNYGAALYNKNVTVTAWTDDPITNLDGTITTAVHYHGDLNDGGGFYDYVVTSIATTIVDPVTFASTTTENVTFTFDQKAIIKIYWVGMMDEGDYKYNHGSMVTLCHFTGEIINGDLDIDTDWGTRGSVKTGYVVYFILNVYKDSADNTLIKPWYAIYNIKLRQRAARENFYGMCICDADAPKAKFDDSRFLDGGYPTINNDSGIVLMTDWDTYGDTSMWRVIQNLGSHHGDNWGGAALYFKDNSTDWNNSGLTGDDATTMWGN